MFRLSNGIFILLENLKGGCHNEVGAPETGLNEARGRCPDAPGFFNIFPGIWTGDHPPRKYHTPRLSKVKDIFINRGAHEIREKTRI